MMDIDKIVKILNEKSKVIAIKTDTVYGLICNAHDKKAVEKIYDIKSRDKMKPLSLFVKNIDEVKKIVADENLIDENISIMKRYWPGALTIVFKKRDDTYDHMTKNTTGIGIRIPKDELLLNLLSVCDFPLAETSCNESGEEPYRNYDEIKEKLGDKVDMIVDGGDVTDNTASTVISLASNKMQILRTGSIKLV